MNLAMQKNTVTRYCRKKLWLLRSPWETCTNIRFALEEIYNDVGINFPAAVEEEASRRGGHTKQEAETEGGGCGQQHV